MRLLLRRLSDAANRATEIALVPIVAFFTLLLVVAVLSRYVLQLPIVTSIEMTRIAFVWACFLGAAVGLKRGLHVRVVAFVSLAPTWCHSVIPVIVHGSFLIFALLMVWQGWGLTARMFVTTFPTLGISQGWLYMALPVAGALMALHAASALLSREPAGHDPAPEEMGA
jgi:TRAP-type C4-dicarboxylate transport system permease small subunit